MKVCAVIIAALIISFIGCTRKDNPADSGNQGKTGGNEYSVSIEYYGPDYAITNFKASPYYPDSICMSWTYPDTGKTRAYYIRLENLSRNLADFPAKSFDMRYTIVCKNNPSVQNYFDNAHYYLCNSLKGPLASVYISKKL